MEDNYYYYFSLHAYLSRADQHYLEGRLLWANHAIDGACNLFWLAIEQMIKLIIIQKRIEKKSLNAVHNKEDRSKKVLNYDPQEKDIRKIHKILDKTSYNLNSKHQLDELLKILMSFQATLEKVKEYYERRYYKDEASSIRLTELDNIDEVYFFLRKNVNQNIPRSLIDEISYQRKFNTGHPLPHFILAYYQNKSFLSRRHPVVFQQLPNKKIIKNDGVLDEFTETVPPLIPLHAPIRSISS